MHNVLTGNKFGCIDMTSLKQHYLTLIEIFNQNINNILKE